MIITIHAGIAHFEDGETVDMLQVVNLLRKVAEKQKAFETDEDYVPEDARDDLNEIMEITGNSKETERIADLFAARQ